MHKTFGIATILILLSIAPLNGQNEEYLRKQAKTLSSFEMQGRGYVNQGLEKAAGHIHHQFDSLGLRSFKKDYCQKFKMAVNTFPFNTKLKIDGEELELGKDYQPDAFSGDGTGIFEPLFFDKENLNLLPEPGKLNIPGKQIILVLDLGGIKDKDSLAYYTSLKYGHSVFLPVLSVVKEKLTWSVGKEKSENAIIEVLQERIDKNAKRIEIDVKAELKTDFVSMNMMAYVKGKQEPDSFIVFTAHYDHLGMIGDKTCYFGANDNASGCAYLLELARHYAGQKNKYSMVFIAFAGEEAGLVGSKHYVENPVFPLQNIKFLINIDLMGSGEEGLTVVNGTLFETEFKTLSKINKEQGLLEKIKIRGPAANSDHYWFTQKGVPAFFIYTLGGSTAYHDIYDRYENLTFFEFQDIFSLLTTFVSQIE